MGPCAPTLAALSPAEGHVLYMHEQGTRAGAEGSSVGTMHSMSRSERDGSPSLSRARLDAMLKSVLYPHGSSLQVRHGTSDTRPIASGSPDLSTVDATEQRADARRTTQHVVE